MTRPESHPQTSPPEAPAAPDSPSDPSRRTFITTASTMAMAVGLLASYGACFATGAGFLYPRGTGTREWQYLAVAKELKVGDQINYQAPDGATVVVARQGGSGEVEDFLALSDTCPHLGCKVHWQGDRNRFFCPCHNGVFSPEGKGISGPPGDAGQSLSRYPLKIDGGVLYIMVPMQRLA